LVEGRINEGEGVGAGYEAEDIEKDKVFELIDNLPRGSSREAELDETKPTNQVKK